ncbi:hypothetical protein OIO90_005229 [Microbotryomycetes sp. JL221]|nr:hypothetical protein OIO90_005229 [Microbotryomycetes sp. JL221]
MRYGARANSSTASSPVINLYRTRTTRTSLNPHQTRSTSSSWSKLIKSKPQIFQTLIVLIVLWFEYATFYFHSRWKCQFDDRPSTDGIVFDPVALDNNQVTLHDTNLDHFLNPFAKKKIMSDQHLWVNNTSFKQIKPFHVLIASDPQLLDMKSYPGRPKLLKWLGIKVTDMYAKKSWRFVTKFSKGLRNNQGIDGIVWLGDLLDSGVETSDHKEYSRYVHRFHKQVYTSELSIDFVHFGLTFTFTPFRFPKSGMYRTFPLPRQKLIKSIDTSLHPPVPTIYIPGNHDLGLHLESQALETWQREKFKQNFESIKGLKEWNDWDLIWIDSMALLENDSNVIYNEAKIWIEKMGKRRLTRPRVLFSHIPLFRPEGTPCGIERESSRPLHQGRGKNYQNELDEQTTKWLIETLKPSIVFSGDDHDSCVIKHPFMTPKSNKPVIETTVKAFSMAMGIRQPGYTLLSLYAPLDSSRPTTSSTYTLTNCVLPDQIGIWLFVYLPITSLILFLSLLPKLFKIFKQICLNVSNFLSSNQSKRRLTSARSNGLPVVTNQVGLGLSPLTNGKRHHRKQSSLSKLLSAVTSPILSRSTHLNNEMNHINDDEDLDSQFPTFAYVGDGQLGGQRGTRVVSSNGGIQDDFAAYHAGLGSDDGPTSAYASSEDDEDNDRIDNGTGRVRTGSFVMGRGQSGIGKVRRVSRVWTWNDGKNSNGHGLTIAPDFNGQNHLIEPVVMTRFNNNNKRKKFKDCFRWIVKPSLRLIRGLTRKVFWLPKLFVGLLARTILGEAVVVSCAETFEIVWPGVVAWVVVWTWFSVT